MSTERKKWDFSFFLMNLKKNTLYLSYQKFESKSYRKMDFSSFHYYGDYLMLITIEPFKERKKARVYFVFILRKPWHAFHTSGILKSTERFH